MNSGKTAGRAMMTGVGIMLCVVLIPLLIVNITILIYSVVCPNEVPGFFSYKPIIVLSDSMEPTIKLGSLAFVKQTDVNQLKNGDIVAYKEDNLVITHRIVENRETAGTRQFTTKGDGNSNNDPLPVTEKKIVGIYLFSIPKLGYLALFLQTPLGIILFITLPLMLLLLYDIIHRKSFKQAKLEMCENK